MRRKVMATPVLRGNDAKKFLLAIKNPRPYISPVFDLEKMRQEVRKFVKKRESV